MRLCSTYKAGGPKTKKAIAQSLKNCSGGQSAAAAKQIARKVSKIRHHTYVEPFLGMGTVYRAAAQPDKKLVVNDKSCARVSIARKRFCGTNKQSDSCEKFKKTRVSCGRDYREFLRRYDKPGVVMYLDPPYERTRSGKSKAALRSSQSYSHRGDGVPFDKFLKAVRGVRRATVLISYTDIRPYNKQLCMRPFKCSRVKKSIMANRYTEILAIKRGR